MPLIQRILVLGIGFLLGVLVSDRFTQNFIEDQVDLQSVQYHAFKRSDFYRSSKSARSANPFDTQKTLSRLQNMFTYEAGLIESNLVQFGDVPTTDRKFKSSEYSEEWKKLNSDYEYHYLVESDVDEIIQSAFEEEIPEIYEAFNLLPKSILKSDFARYLLVYLFGGVYSEIDTKACIAVDDWDPTGSQLVVGIETDNNILTWEHSQVRLSFAHYTFKAKKHHPFLAMLISEVVKKTFVADLEDSMVYDENIKGMESCRAIKTPDWTGSTIFSETLFKYLNQFGEPTIYQFNLERESGNLYGPETNATISWKTFTSIKEPVKVEDTFVLPLEAFSSTRAAVTCEGGNSYVIHGSNSFTSNPGGSKEDKMKSHRNRIKHKLSNSSRRGRKRPNSKKGQKV